jgi:(p)ppGpp synthase/HD superfamily hydrolase
VSAKPANKSTLKKKPIKLGPRFRRAFLFASEKHAKQARKASTIPYIAHLMGVASLVLEFGGDEDMAIAALLHDVVEDCGGKPMLAQVRRRFGGRVAKIVDGCTDSYVIPKLPWRERKDSYIRHLKNADAETRLVSAADKLNNVRSILADYRTLLEEFMRQPNRLVREFELEVRELEQYANSRSQAQGRLINAAYD